MSTNFPALVATGLADFVARSASCLSMAIDLIEERLRQSVEEPRGTSPLLRDENNQEAFGETLRHELNNPLTGILGNAELLLAEVRRKNDGQLPNGGQQRLETIAALAVRFAKPFVASARTGKIATAVCHSVQSSSALLTDSRREKHRLTLKHLHRKKKRDAGVNTGAPKNQRYVFPVIRPGDQLLAEQPNIQNRHQRKLRRQLDSRESPPRLPERSQETSLASDSSALL